MSLNKVYYVRVIYREPTRYIEAVKPHARRGQFTNDPFLPLKSGHLVN